MTPRRAVREAVTTQRYTIWRSMHNPFVVVQPECREPWSGCERIEVGKITSFDAQRAQVVAEWWVRLRKDFMIIYIDFEERI